MTLRLILLRGLLPLALLALAGCVPSVQSQSDEEKESHFLAGKSRNSTMDYRGAIESFEKALEVNPHSASAHFELGCLFDQREPDPAAAIYHYEKYLKLRPEAGNSDMVKLRISTCKQELAKNVSLGPLTERQQREYEALIQKNKKLEEDLKQMTNMVEGWRAYAAHLKGLTNAMSAQQPYVSGQQASQFTSSNNSPSRTPAISPAAGSRTHTVKAGETLTVIARKYGVRIDSLTAANPAVNSRRLQVGQVLQVPSS